MTTSMRSYAAEVLGTFTLVFIGTTAVVAASREATPGLLVAPFAFGLALLAGLYAFAEVSGGHFNPVVSWPSSSMGDFPSSDLIGYWVSQFVGGILASLVLLIATNQKSVASTATIPSSNGTAFVIEVTLTAIFVLVILQSTKSERFGGTALVAIPLTLLAAHFAAIPFSGCSLNPARTFGPDLVGNVWTGIWVYFIATPIGAAIAWVVHSAVVSGKLGAPAPSSST